MKLIKIKSDHYIVVDDSEIKRGDWYYLPRTNSVYQCNEDPTELNLERRYGVAKVTHSTQPLNTKFNDWFDVQIITLSEVKELLGEMDVEKKMISPYPMDTQNDVDWCNGYQRGYTQALEDNKKKKYSRDEAHALMCKAFEQGFKKADIVEAKLESKETDIECAWILTKYDSTPKTTWEVEFDENGKLKLV